MYEIESGQKVNSAYSVIIKIKIAQELIYKILKVKLWNLLKEKKELVLQAYNNEIMILVCGDQQIGFQTSRVYEPKQLANPCQWVLRKLDYLTLVHNLAEGSDQSLVIWTVSDHVRLFEKIRLIPLHRPKSCTPFSSVENSVRLLCCRCSYVLAWSKRKRSFVKFMLWYLVQSWRYWLNFKMKFWWKLHVIVAVIKL